MEKESIDLLELLCKLMIKKKRIEWLEWLGKLDEETSSSHEANE